MHNEVHFEFPFWEPAGSNDRWCLIWVSWFCSYFLQQRLTTLVPSDSNCIFRRRSSLQCNDKIRSHQKEFHSCPVRQWTELLTCGEESTFGQAVRAAMRRQVTQRPEARDKKWPDRQLPQKLVQKGCWRIFAGFVCSVSHPSCYSQEVLLGYQQYLFKKLVASLLLL